MAILHGSWIQTGNSQGVGDRRGFFCIWGETWKRIQAEEYAKPETTIAHPLAIAATELTDFLTALKQQGSLNWELPADATPKKTTSKRKKTKKEPSELDSWQQVTLALPSYLPPDSQAPIPLHSAEDPGETEVYLYPWQVEALCLKPMDAIAFLSALPLGAMVTADAFIGEDLRFWSHVARWSLDLQARCKFLPQIDRQIEGTAIACWQPLLDSDTDRKRLTRFTKQMPVACRTYQPTESGELAIGLPPEPQELLREFLSRAIDARIRVAVSTDPVPNLVSPVQEWLEALLSDSATIETQPEAIAKIETAIETWIAPVTPHLAGQQPFRAAFELVPPEYGDNRWTLQYFLQAADDPYCLVDAKTIWNNPVEKFVYQGRTIEYPQETLLQGLGLASRLFPAIEQSLETQTPQSCAIAPMQAYDFLKSGAWRFEDSGLGVIVPDSLSNREGWATRLGLAIRAETPTRPKGGFGLQNLLDFKWELTIGGQRISKKEFDRLVALNSPLVEINGEWVELREVDIRAAQEFFKSRKNQMSLTLEDALRLSTGDTQAIEKLPVVKFEAGGQLEELLNTLTNKRSLEEIEKPANFKGELRPYQARGVSWLSFLERWGLGACLADDMGLGKCLAPESLIFVNGGLQTAEYIWETYAGKTEFDGEGFWTKPTAELSVNSIDNQTGKIVESRVRRLYRQQVCEKLRKVTLEDGSSITITRRHQLLTRDGWTNHFQVGDRICVPAKLLWQGQPQDPDLVKFLAEKIAAESKQNNAVEQSIPPFIMQADADSVRIFLRHYFDAESSAIASMRSVEISSASPLLMQQLSVLLRRFGIWLRIAPKQKRATNGSGIFHTYYMGTFGGNSARKFLQEIGFSNPEKQWKLETICDRTSNTNVEGIPASDIVARAVQMTQLPVRHLGMHNTVYLNGSQEFSRTSLERVVVGIERILTGETEREYRQLKPSKWTTQTLEAYAQIDVDRLRLTQQNLQALCDREVFYCAIAKIEEIDYQGWVYDLEVSENHNFVANNILCHNTIQTIAFLLHLQEENQLENPVLLVCPTSVLGNWEREVKKFGSKLKVMVHHGDKRAKGKAFAKSVQGKNLVITSYPLVYRDEKDLQTVPWQGVVLDEAQNIKNPQAKQSKAVRGLIDEETQPFRIALTGTPVENRLQELWSIVDFLNPGYLGARQFFQRRFATPIEKYGDTDSLEALRSLVRPFILRRLKSDKDIIQDLPEKQENPVFCGLSVEQAKLYQKMVDETLAEIESAEGIQRHGLILALLVKLKQICNHPAQFLKQKTLENPHRSGKLVRLEEMVEELLAEGDRALIFTQFAEWGKLLQPYLSEKLGREILFLYGGTRKKQREEMVDRFQHDPQGPPIMILSIKAGGVGLNLTRANHVFHYDRWWNPAVENQATDRVFRIGQTQNVQVHKFISTGTLEEKIHDLIESKKELAEQVVGAGEQWLTELDSDRLRNLLILDRNAIVDEEVE